MMINFNALARQVAVDNRIPLYYYYRIADNLLRQANIYRDEKNILDLYIILLRYSSLVSETIPYHRDYQAQFPKEKTTHRKRLLAVLDELESLKPKVDCLVDELNRAAPQAQSIEINDQGRAGSGSETASSTLEWPPVNGRSSSKSWKYNNGRPQAHFPNAFQMEKQFQNLSFRLPPPKQETLSRHSFLGPDGLRGQWHGPKTEIKVEYPSNKDLPLHHEDLVLNQDGHVDTLLSKNTDSTSGSSAMDSVLSLDDGRWSCITEEPSRLLINEMKEDPFQFVGLRQPPPPPVLAKVQQEFAPIPPSKVADPRPGPAKPFENEVQGSNSYQHLHVPVNMMDDFLRLARANTNKNLETCGVLAGSLKNRVFHITTLIIPKQESTSDSCQTLNEEEIFEVQDRLSLFPLGWIHTHPSQTCFMSSVDLHTHYSYQIMLPEAVAIVMAPTDTSSPHGIFHLSDPGGVSVIRNCQQRGFHPHEEPDDGSPLYEHCAHVYLNPKIKFDVVDLR